MLGYWRIKGRELNLSEVGDWRSALEEPNHWKNFNYCRDCGVRIPNPRYWIELFESIGGNIKLYEEDEEI